MPGMMDTILNLGLNDETRGGPGRSVGRRALRARLATAASSRCTRDVVLEIDREHFEHELVAAARARRREERRRAPGRGAARARRHVQEDRPQEAPATTSRRTSHEQLWGAIGAVFNSWNNQRAITYRKLNSIPDDWGTAVNVQSMVFGNMGDDCATGVAFTRNPVDRREEVLRRVPAQRAGRGRRRRHPHAAADLEAQTLARSRSKRPCPRSTTQLVDVYKKLEKHYSDMQDIEFTIETRKLYLLQTRTGKRTGFAAVRIAVRHGRRRADHADEAVERVEAGPDHRSCSRRCSTRRRKRRRSTAAASSAAACPPVPARRGADRLHRRERGAHGQGRAGDPGAHRDVARGHRRHAQRRGHPHHARRHDLARGRRRARHGPPCVVGAGVAARRLRQGRAAQRRARAARGRRLAVDRRHHRRDHRRQARRRGRPRSCRSCSKAR